MPPPARRALTGLALVALALSPVLALLFARPSGEAEAPPPALEAPASEAAAPDAAASEEPAPNATAQPPADGTGHPAGAGGTEPRPGAAPPPPSAAPAGPSRPPAAPERWKGIAACPREKVSGGQYNRCLYDVTRTSEQALEAELNNAVAVIEARTDLQGVQRNRWKTLLDEAQSRFLLFRNLDCQGVAPFEGPRGIGNFEQRALCLIEANRLRAGELRARYGAPRPTPEPGKGAATGPHERPGSWTHPAAPPLE